MSKNTAARQVKAMTSYFWPWAGSRCAQHRVLPRAIVVIPLATYVLQKAIFKVSLPQLSLPSAAVVVGLLFVLFEITSERGVAAGVAALAEKERAAQDEDGPYPADAWRCTRVGLVAVDRDTLAVLGANPKAQQIGTDFEDLAEESRQRLRRNIERGAGLLYLERGESLYEVSVTGCTDEAVYLLMREVPADLLDRRRRERQRRERRRRQLLQQRRRQEEQLEQLLAAFAELLEPALELVRHQVLLAATLGQVTELYEVLKPLRKKILVRPESITERWVRGTKMAVAEIVINLLCLQVVTCDFDFAKQRVRAFAPEQRQEARRHLKQQGIVYELDDKTAARLGVSNKPICLWQMLDRFTGSVDELQGRLNRCTDLLAAVQAEQPMHRRLGRPLPTLPPRTPALPSPPDQDNQTTS